MLCTTGEIDWSPAGLNACRADERDLTDDSRVMVKMEAARTSHTPAHESTAAAAPFRA